MLLGSHVKLGEPLMLEGSVLEAISYGANCFMFYTGAPQNTIRKPIEKLRVEEAKKLMKENNIIPLVHAPYILNMASPDEEKRKFSISFLQQELDRTSKIGAPLMVLHPGNHMTNTREEGLDLIVDSLNKVGASNVKIALETMAGKGSELCSSFEEIKYVIDHVNYPLYVCFDTCHVNDAGYDLVNYYDDVFKEFDEIIGLDKIICFHINDSKNALASHKDRHENIGKGYIGFNVLQNLVFDTRFIDVPKILETPYIDGVAPYKEEIEMLKKR